MHFRERLSFEGKVWIGTGNTVEYSLVQSVGRHCCGLEAVSRLGILSCEVVMVPFGEDLSWLISLLQRFQGLVSTEFKQAFRSSKLHRLSIFQGACIDTALVLAEYHLYGLIDHLATIVLVIFRRHTYHRLQIVRVTIRHHHHFIPLCLTTSIRDSKFDDIGARITVLFLVGR